MLQVVISSALHSCLANCILLFEFKLILECLQRTQIIDREEIHILELHIGLTCDFMKPVYFKIWTSFEQFNIFSDILTLILFVNLLLLAHWIFHWHRCLKVKTLVARFMLLMVHFSA
jgi:hypothetical protein